MGRVFEGLVADRASRGTAKGGIELVMHKMFPFKNHPKKESSCSSSLRNEIRFQQFINLFRCRGRHYCHHKPIINMKVGISYHHPQSQCMKDVFF